MQLLKAHDLTEQSRAVFADARSCSSTSESTHRGCSLINEDLCAVCTICVSLRVCDVFPSAASSLCLQVHNVSFSFELMQDGGLERPKPRPEGRMSIQHICAFEPLLLYTLLYVVTHQGPLVFVHFLVAVINYLLLAKDQIAYNDIQADKHPSSLELGLRTFAMSRGSLWL